MQDFFISNNEIIESVNHLKDKILRTAENIPSYFLKRTICSLIFPISFLFNCSLAIIYIFPTKTMVNILYYTNIQKRKQE